MPRSAKSAPFLRTLVRARPSTPKLTKTGPVIPPTVTPEPARGLTDGGTPSLRKARLSARADVCRAGAVPDIPGSIGGLLRVDRPGSTRPGTDTRGLGCGGGSRNGDEVGWGSCDSTRFRHSWFGGGALAALGRAGFHAQNRARQRRKRRPERLYRTLKAVARVRIPSGLQGETLCQRQLWQGVSASACSANRANRHIQRHQLCRSVSRRRAALEANRL